MGRVVALGACPSRCLVAEGQTCFCGDVDVVDQVELPKIQEQDRGRD